MIGRSWTIRDANNSKQQEEYLIHKALDESFTNSLIAGPSLLTELFDKTKSRMPFRACRDELACILALIDASLDHRGLLKMPLLDVATEYRRLLGNITFGGLQRARDFLMHEGPILGLTCTSTQEFKWVSARHLADKDFERESSTQNRWLRACFNCLKGTGEANLLVFSELCRVIYQEGKSPRLISAARIKQITGVDSRQSAFFRDLYLAMPDAPLDCS
ncbi:hypothetical protein D6779_11435 [Candidatus Parcubacteria bacterium]|nr:MAG: hypothetical protein D6779_11435 [Candidatus Parcubacteria bacterium]